MDRWILWQKYHLHLQLWRRFQQSTAPYRRCSLIQEFELHVRLKDGFVHATHPSWCSILAQSLACIRRQQSYDHSHLLQWSNLQSDRIDLSQDWWILMLIPLFLEFHCTICAMESNVVCSRLIHCLETLVQKGLTRQENSLMCDLAKNGIDHHLRDGICIFLTPELWKIPS